MSCPFCTLPSDVILREWPDVIAIRDRDPASPGHVLVIPRRHVETYFDATIDEKRALWESVDDIQRELDASMPRPDGYNVGFNAGAAAGQTVMHVHVHVIPRFAGDVDDPRGGIRGAVPSRRRPSSE